MSRAETPEDLSITRLGAMDDPTRIPKATEDIHTVALNLRLRDGGPEGARRSGGG